MAIRVRLSKLRKVLLSFALFTTAVILFISSKQGAWKGGHRDWFEEQETDLENVFVMDNPDNCEGLNHHIWVNICTTNLDHLCDIPLFPNVPSYRRIINTTRFSWPGKDNYGQRIFGFLSPPQTDMYNFAVSSDDSSEFWLSGDARWENSEMVAYVGGKLDDTSWTEEMEFNKYPGQISKDFYLEAGQYYYIEINHFQQGHGNHFIVAWKNSKETNFSVIEGEHLRPFYSNDSRLSGKYDAAIHEAKSCQTLENSKNNFLKRKHEEISEFRHFLDVLPKCPNYDKLQKINIAKQYDGLKKHFRATSVYPFLMNTNHLHLGKRTNWYPRILDRNNATDIVHLYMERIYSSFGSKFKLVSIENVEKKNFTRGSRYLLELQLNDTSTNKTIRLSNYIYRTYNSTEFCHPVQIQWNRRAPITFVLTVRKQGIWVYVFLKNMADIIKAAKEEDINIVIFDYDSPDLDLGHAVRTSGIAERIKTLSKPGRYSRRESFNLAMAEVRDHHTIVVLMDLHMEITSAIINDIRKHCIESEQIYTPLIVRLFGCSTPSNPFYWWVGYWEDYGFGIAAMYKSDWDRIGGFKYDDENKNTWGGEDYDLVDSAVRVGLGYERVGCPYIYHYEHERKEMWKD